MIDPTEFAHATKAERFRMLLAADRQGAKVNELLDFVRNNENLFAESLRCRALLVNPDQKTLDRVVRVYEQNRNGRFGLDAPRAVLADLLEMSK